MSESPGIVIDDAVVSTTGRKVGYAVTIVLNGVLLFIANNLLAWGWFPWLTDDFERVLPVLNTSIIVSMIVNTVFLAYDPRWFKTVADILTTSLSIAVGVRMWQVFPFDFSRYDRDWAHTVRWIIAIGIFGATIALIVNIALLARIALGYVPDEDE